MDVVKIKIGSREYDIKDAVVRNWINGTGNNDFVQQVKNIFKYGIADITGKTQALLEQLESQLKEYLFTEFDPIFTQHIANKLVGTVNNVGVLTLIGE